MSSFSTPHPHDPTGRTVIAKTIEVLVLPDARKDKTDEERQREKEADKMPRSEVLRAFKWSDTDFELARDRYSFPQGVQGMGRGWGWPRPEAIFSRRAVAAWRTELLAIAGIR